MQSLKKKRGFTLIELLVVIAIIGTLATIVMVSLNTARSKARDTRRAADLRSISLALEMYYDASTTGYPAALSSLVPTYIPVVPKDPKTTADYTYAVCTGSNKYTLAATMENSTFSGLANDVDSGACGTAAACVDTSPTFGYCVEP